MVTNTAVSSLIEKKDNKKEDSKHRASRYLASKLKGIATQLEHDDIFLECNPTGRKPQTKYRSSAELIIAHPKMLERIFVVVPLLEIAPDVKLPSGKLVRRSLKGLSVNEAEIRKIGKDEDPF